MATKNNKKQLSLAHIKKMGKEYKDQKTVEYGEYSFKVDVKFGRYKIEQMFREMSKIVDKTIKEEKIDIREYTYEVGLIYNMLIVKYFTNIPIHDNVTWVELLAIAEDFINAGLFKFIQDQFDVEELNRLSEVIRELLDRIDKMSDQILEDEDTRKLDEIIDRIEVIKNEKDK